MLYLKRRRTTLEKQVIDLNLSISVFACLLACSLMDELYWLNSKINQTTCEEGTSEVKKDTQKEDHSEGIRVWKKKPLKPAEKRPQLFSILPY